MEATPPPLPRVQRHGCLTAFLIFSLFGNTVALLIYLFAGGRVAAEFPDGSTWIVYVLAAVCGLNSFLTISLFRWKKWAFYALCVVAAVMFIVNVSLGVPMIRALAGVAGLALLYGVLQIGGPNKGWSQLK